MATTERGEYVFRCKEYPDNTPWIILELMRGPGLDILSGGLLGFDLAEGTTLDEAQELVKILNERVTTTAYTRLK
jgi:hypothetical protein